MRQLERIKRSTFVYFILAFMFAGGALLPFSWAQFAAAGCAVVAAGFGIEGCMAYYRVYRWEQFANERRLETITPDVTLHQARAVEFGKLIEFARMVKSMTPEQLKNTTLLVPEFLDNYIPEPTQRYYTQKEAQLVLFIWTEQKHGFVYLPSMWDVASGSRLQNVIKTVTDDLISAGCANRDKKNTRAYLTVSQEDAYEVLYGEGETK